MPLEVGRVERAHCIVHAASHLGTPSGRHPNLFRKPCIEGGTDKQGIAREPIQTETIEATHVAHFGSDQDVWPDLCRDGSGQGKLRGVLPIAAYPRARRVWLINKIEGRKDKLIDKLLVHNQ